MLTQRDLFRSGEEGYHTFRIPAVALAPGGTLLAFCEGRKKSIGDHGDIDVVLKRSTDGGRTWLPLQIVEQNGSDRAGNPAPVVDRVHGVVYLAFTKQPADASLERVSEGLAETTVWLTKSTDDGAHWTEPVEITAQVKEASWTHYATGPGHGIQLASGRLLLPCDHRVGRYWPDERHRSRSHVVFSDDYGATWQIGGILDEGTNECVAVELDPGTVYINSRNASKRDPDQDAPAPAGPKHRCVAWSNDVGMSFSPVVEEKALIEPVCQASAIRLRGDEAHWVLFSNPAGSARRGMAIRVSRDGCRTWSAPKVLHPGPSAYSDLCELPDGSVVCLYERGDTHTYERLTLAHFDRDWLVRG